MKNLKIQTTGMLLLIVFLSIDSSLLAQGYSRGYGRMYGVGNGYFLLVTCLILPKNRKPNWMPCVLNIGRMCKTLKI